MHGAADGRGVTGARGGHGTAARTVRDAEHACARADAHGDGAVIALMWAGIARYLTRTGHNWLGGCCSLPLADGGATAAAVWAAVAERHLAPAAHRVRPRLP
ncbi:hypothetical protein ACLIYN_11050, partial [Streptomyces atacamensis]